MDSHDAEQAQKDAEQAQKKAEQAQKDGEQAQKVVQRFQIAHTDRQIRKAIKDVETLLDTCETGDIVLETMVELRKICVRKKLGRKFNQWRKQYMQRAKRELPDEKELKCLPQIPQSELIKWLKRKLDDFAPAITDKKDMSQAMGALTSRASVDQANADFAMRINAPLLKMNPYYVSMEAPDQSDH